jgi:urease accessory protein
MAAYDVGNSFLAGLAHPFMNVSHLVFIILLGLLASRKERGGWIVLTFVASSILGIGLLVHKASLVAPGIAIAAAVIALGGMLALMRVASVLLLSILGGLAGFLYGYAYNAFILDSGASSLLAYGFGFGFIQITIALFALVLGRLLSDHQPGRFSAILQWMGLGIIGAVIVATGLKAASLIP